MLKTEFFDKSPMHSALRETLSPLFYLLGKLEGKIDEEESQQLADDLVHSFPAPPQPGQCSDCDRVLSWYGPDYPVSIIQKGEEEPIVYCHEQAFFSGMSGNIPDSLIKLGRVSTWEPLFYFQEAFTVLQEYYPLRAAAYYLRILTRIWVGLVEENKLDIMMDEEFIHLYHDALLQVEALSARCGRCAQTDEVNL